MKVHYFICIILLTAGNIIILYFRYNRKDKKSSRLLSVSLSHSPSFPKNASETI